MNLKRVFEEGGKVSKSLLSLYAIVALLAGGAISTYTFATMFLNEWSGFKTEFAAEFQEIRIQIDRLETQVKIANAPVVAEYSAATRVEGPCVAGEDCLMVARIRRHRGAEDCMIIPQRTRYFLVSYADFFERTMERQDASIRNVGNNFETVELKLRIPEATPPGPAEIRITAQYKGCEWQTNGEPPVIQTSPAFPVVIEDAPT